MIIEKPKASPETIVNNPTAIIKNHLTGSQSKLPSLWEVVRLPVNLIVNTSRLVGDLWQSPIVSKGNPIFHDGWPSKIFRLSSKRMIFVSVNLLQAFNQEG